MPQKSYKVAVRIVYCIEIEAISLIIIFQGRWKGKSAGGCLNDLTWRFNPQLFISIEKKRAVTIKLTQEGTEYHIGFYVALTDGIQYLLFSFFLFFFHLQYVISRYWKTSTHSIKK